MPSTFLVRSKSPNGFRRAGFFFTRDGIELDGAKIAPAALAAIRCEPELEVIGDVPEAAYKPAKPAKPAKSAKAD